MLLLIKALLLGIVEGVTEFLPISSTGHLIIASEVLDYPEAQRATFEIFIQLGAILAVFWHYRLPLIDLASRVPRETKARAFVAKVALAFLPAAFVGLLIHEQIERYLFHPRVVAGALVAGGIAILLVESRRRPVTVSDIEEMSWRDALWVGVAQIASLFPGVSRAGATIIGGLLAGLNRPVAIQFSFYLALPTITAASLFSLTKSMAALTTDEIAPFSVGLVAAFVSALVVIRRFLSYVQFHDFKIFGYYRIAFGLLVYVLA
jgi:undecaprenyl-diphosphatase